ncbi:MAG TPA: ABC transporter permease subunit [Anaerolineae bacterium]|nr:ABC transporter permease subunit [Anaerolineae bacterium]
MNVLTIAELTIRESQRRRILWLAVVMGLLFLMVYGLGIHYIFREIEAAGVTGEVSEVGQIFLTMAGLYVTNFLMVIMAVLVSVASISGEIDMRIIDTVVTKPVNRWELILGKWVGFAVLIVGYMIFLAGGVIGGMYWRTGFRFEQPLEGLLLMCLSAILMMTVTLAGGTRLSTLANGVLAFMLYGVAFIGGWVETIGGMFKNEMAVNLGIVSSLILPVDALWKKGMVYFEPRVMGNFYYAGPFVVTAEPSDLMVWYAVFYVVVVLGWAMWSLGRRDL